VGLEADPRGQHDPSLAKNQGQRGSGSMPEGQGKQGSSNTFIRKKVMLVSKSTVDLRSWSRSGLLAGKLFCQRGRKRAELHRKLSHRGEWRGRKQTSVYRIIGSFRLEKTSKIIRSNHQPIPMPAKPCPQVPRLHVISDLIRRVGKPRRRRLTRYMERSIRSELCSWSRSLTNRSFCGETPRRQVSRGKAAGTVPPPCCPWLSLPPAWPAPPPAHPSPPCCPSFPRALRVGMGGPRRRACPHWWLGLAGSRRRLPGCAGPRQAQQRRSRGSTTRPRRRSVPRRRGAAPPALPARPPLGLGWGQERGEGVQDRAPGPHGPWREASEELRRKGAGKERLGSRSRHPSSGPGCFQTRPGWSPGAGGPRGLLARPAGLHQGMRAANRPGFYTGAERL